jgi:hypothetical protein
MNQSPYIRIVLVSVLQLTAKRFVLETETLHVLRQMIESQRGLAKEKAGKVVGFRLTQAKRQMMQTRTLRPCVSLTPGVGFNKACQFAQIALLVPSQFQANNTVRRAAIQLGSTLFLEE